MKNKVLLINLPCHSTMQDFVDNSFQYNPALGLLAITDYLSMFDFEAFILDYNYNEINYGELFDYINKKGVTMIAFTAYTENLNTMLKFIRIVKKQFRNVKIAVGGPHATLRPEEIIKNQNVDFVLSRDGEATFLELMLHLEMGDDLISLDKIKGLYYSAGEKKIQNEDRQVVSDLNLLPIINRERVDTKRYRSIVSIYSSKGCPAKCIYCSASAISGAKYRMRNIKNVFLECQVIYNQMEPDTDKLYFIDDTFTVNVKRVREWCSLCNEYKLKMKWSCESRVDVMNEEIIDLIAGTDCFSIQFGVESGNQEVLNKIKKNIKLSHLERIVDYVKQYKIGIFLSLILGHFCDTEETMMETIELARRLRKLNPNVEYGISVNTPFPGTWQYENADKIGLRITDRDYSNYDLITPVIETEHFNKARLEELRNVANSLI
ncbi:B12-binding domain-containing radical SAM protein [Anaerocolumna aminovalerica]|uniref:B12-binding domain-containing radical SAM protein n=1 Tax=Anaerocolumna aminovalerica TaxID=1527 RepID=UPI00248AB8E6|nr:radical SAM protein [Anaerocolumna aminovalerica]